MRAAVMMGLIALAAVSTAGCGEAEADKPTSVSVIAATSLKEPFTEIAAQAESEHAGIQYKLSFVPSDKIEPQLKAGYDADVVATASPKHMRLLAGADAVGEPQAFAGNDLVIGVAKNAKDEITSPKDLAGDVRLSIGDPSVPIGSYTEQSLAALGKRYGADFSKAVEGNVVNYGQSAADVLAPVALGGVDASISYSSDVAGASGGVTPVAIPSWAQPEISYWIALRPGADALGAEFLEAVQSEAGQRELAKAGFSPPPEGAEL